MAGPKAHGLIKRGGICAPENTLESSPWRDENNTEALITIYTWNLILYCKQRSKCHFV